MNSSKQRKPKTALVAWVYLLACGFCLAATPAVDSQEREDARSKRDDPPIRQQRMLLVDEPDQQHLGNGLEGANVVVRGGVRTSSRVDRDRNVTIVEDPERGIVVEVTQHFDSTRMQQLKDQHPELRDYIDLFPTQIDDQQIELSISLKKRFEARNAQELKTKSLFAFSLYRRHVERNGDHLANPGK